MVREVPRVRISSSKGLLCALGVLAIALPAGLAASDPPPALTFQTALGRTLQLYIEPVFINGASAVFLDHRTSNGLNILLASNAVDRSLYYSTDMARSWTNIPNTDRRQYRRGFVTEDGNLLLWDRQTYRMDLCDLQGNVLGTHTDAPLPWHGSWGIGQAGSTILYAEYADTPVQEVRVFRSEDGGKTWAVVFSQRGPASEKPQVRHFHTVQPDPFFPHHWYLSSGDHPSQSRVWLSKDDGKTWVEVTDRHSAGFRRHSLHRYTSIVFTKDFLYWATDDLVGVEQAQVVRAKRGEPLALEVVGAAGAQCMRNAIVTDFGLLLISEAKNAKTPGANIYLFTPPNSIQSVGSVPRVGSQDVRSPVTLSLSSKSSVGGEFFTWACPRVELARGTLLALWRLTALPQ